MNYINGGRKLQRQTETDRDRDRKGDRDRDRVSGKLDSRCI